MAQRRPAWRRAAAACIALAAAGAAAHPGLTDAELRWLSASQPVLAYARQAGLPVDIIVQPTVHPDISPLSMAFIDGRCKLVLTMRGNPAVERQFQGVEPAIREMLIETMAAHEIGHCWRHRQGAWRALPSGFMKPVATGNAEDPGDHMADQRREEGFADLVGLAWARNRHPAHYAQVHAWLSGERGTGNAPGLAHDTAVWVELAQDPAAFRERGTLFEQALGLWEQGVRLDD